MRSITALLHTKDDGLRLGRALETLYACDEVLVVDCGSRDGTLRVAREYGARVLNASPGLTTSHYAGLARTDWILSLAPCESLTESLSATLYEWKKKSSFGSAFSVFVREETPEGWIEIPAAQTRLVPQTWKLWNGQYPANQPSAAALKGEVLRFRFP